MRQIRYTCFGQTFQVPEDMFLSILVGAVDGLHGLGRELFARNSVGLVELPSELRTDHVTYRQLLEQVGTLVGAIEDEQLQGLVRQLLAGVQRVYELDEQLVAVVARYLDLPLPQGRQSCQKLRRRMDAKEHAGRGWLFVTAYQRVLAEGARACRALSRTKREIDARLVELLAGLSGPGERALRGYEAIQPIASRLETAWSVSTCLFYRHENGIPDVTGDWRALAEEALDGLRAIMPEIDRPVLCASAEAACAHLERLVEIDDRVLEEVARLLGVPRPEDEAAREALWTRLAEYDAVGPVWAREPPLRRLREETLEVGRAAGDNRQRMLAGLREMYAEAAPEERMAPGATRGEAPGPAGDPS